MGLAPKLLKFKTASPVIASYSFSELSSGTSIQKYYPLVSKDDSGDTYNLVEDPQDSYTIQSNSINGTVTLTFDSSEFNLSREVKGVGYLLAHVYESNNAHITVKLQKWDGSSTTDISAVITSGAGVVGETKAFYLEIPVTTPVVINAGEQIRAVITYVATGIGNNKLGHSPTNQTSPTGNLSNTQMILGVPFNPNI